MKRLAAIALSGLALTATGRASAQDAAPHTHAPVPAVAPADRVLGRADAPVTVIEYASFTCPHCAHWHAEVLPRLKAEFIDAGQVRLVFRDLPTEPAQVAATAAAIARCGPADRYFTVVGGLMAGQAAALESGNGQPWIDQAIADTGLTREALTACLREPATREGLEASIRGAVEAGVEGTPSFFVNGRRVVDSSFEGLSAAIRPLLPAG